MRPCTIARFLVLASTIALGSSPAQAQGGSGSRADAAKVAELLSRAGAANAAKSFAAAESLATRATQRLDAQAQSDPMQRAAADLVIARSLVSRRLLTDTRALDAATHALEITEANAPEGDPRRGDAHYVLAWILSSMGHTDGVLEHARSALAIQRRLPEKDAEPVAVTLRLVGLHFERLGLADSARAAYDEALAIRERLNLPRDGSVGSLHIDLSRLEESRGNVAEARTQCDLALREHQSRLGANDPALMQAWRRYSALEWGAGDYSRAADYGERALEIALADPQTDSYDVAVIRATLAWSLYSLEDNARARKLLSEAIPVFTQRLGPAHPQTVHYRTALIELLPAMGDTTAALDELRSLCATLEADSTFGDTNTLADLLGTQAALVVVADPAAAIAICDRAVAVADRHSPADPEVLAQVLGVQLIAHAQRKEWSAVDASIRALKADLDRCAVRGLPTEVWALEQWADAEERRGHLAEAFRLALQSSRQSRQVLLRSLRALPDREGLRFSAGRFPPVHQLLGLTIASAPGPRVVAWDELVRWRGVVGAEIRGRRVPRGDGVDEKVVAAHAEWIRTKGRLAQMETRFASGGRVEGGEAGLDSLRVREEAAEREWARVAPRGLAETATEVGLAEVRAALGPKDALVSFALARRRDDLGRILAFVVRGGAADSAVRVLDLGPADTIEAAVARWREKLGRSPGDDASAERACRTDGAAVRALTWDVIASSVQGAAVVYVVPEGPLHELPWGALPDGEHGYLVERPPTLHVLDAERDLVDRARRGEDAGRGLLALGGIDFDGTKAPVGPSAPSTTLATTLRSVPGCVGEALRALPPLPGTEREVLAIRQERDDSRILTGGDATEAAFKSLAPGCAVLHLATHGIVLTGDCDASSPGTRGVGGVSPLDASKPAASPSSPAPGTRAAREEPSPWLGRRTFLALAGANRASEHVEDENEGFLTAEEVSTLDLRGTAWVVLSACRSGVAESWETEGVLGMRRAFRLAGAWSVIASQWDVDDDATREWMTALYARGTTISTAAEAVERASRRILEARRAGGRSTHPFYWAAFTASGE
ncbi:MAG: CHAT domain-containing tetratricopeptide repeat protein [bacterium]